MFESFVTLVTAISQLFVAFPTYSFWDAKVLKIIVGKLPQKDFFPPSLVFWSAYQRFLNSFFACNSSESFQSSVEFDSSFLPWQSFLISFFKSNLVWFHFKKDQTTLNNLNQINFYINQPIFPHKHSSNFLEMNVRTNQRIQKNCLSWEKQQQWRRRRLWDIARRSTGRQNFSHCSISCRFKQSRVIIIYSIKCLSSTTTIATATK